jgi:AAA+ superfamily predicted ATPase
MSKEAIDELRACIRARDAAIWIRSVEERRVEQVVAAVAKKLDIGLQLWSCATGFTLPSGAAGEEVLDPPEALQRAMAWTSSCIFMMRDFHYYVDPTMPPNVAIIRSIRDIARVAKEQPDDVRKIFIFTSPSVDLPDDLQEEVYVMDWPLPSREEVADAVDAVLEQRKDIAEKLQDGEQESIVDAARGLTMAEAENIFARSIAKTGTLSVTSIAAGKKAAVERDGVLTWIDPDITLDDVGGLEELKAWAAVRKQAFSQEARDFGIHSPKGCLLYGVPGTGKSLSAKALAAAWSMVLLRMDMSALEGSLVGESAQNLIKALEIAVAAAPVVVILDEIEKAMANSTGAGAQLGGTKSDMLGILLTFMQDNTAPVFLAATSNNVEILPPELTRKGRFDEIWFVDLPHAIERQAIWDVHLRKVKRDPEKYGVMRLAAETEGFSGAEIEACVQDALVAAFAEGEELAPVHLLAAIKMTVPLSKTADTKIEDMRNWARGRARIASRPAETVAPSRGNRFAQMKS